MRYLRSFGTAGDAPGQFRDPRGITVVRGLPVVSDDDRVQVLSPTGAPLQVLTFPESLLAGLCTDQERVWVMTATTKFYPNSLTPHRGNCPCRCGHTFHELRFLK